MDEVNVRSHFAVEMREMRSLSGFGEDAIALNLGEISTGTERDMVEIDAIAYPSKYYFQSIMEFYISWGWKSCRHLLLGVLLVLGMKGVSNTWKLISNDCSI
jgi:hypothetical protein